MRDRIVDGIKGAIGRAGLNATEEWRTSGKGVINAVSPRSGGYLFHVHLDFGPSSYSLGIARAGEEVRDGFPMATSKGSRFPSPVWGRSFRDVSFDDRRHRQLTIDALDRELREYAHEHRERVVTENAERDLAEALAKFIEGAPVEDAEAIARAIAEQVPSDALRGIVDAIESLHVEREEARHP